MGVGQIFAVLEVVHNWQVCVCIICVQKKARTRFKE